MAGSIPFLAMKSSNDLMVPQRPVLTRMLSPSRRVALFFTFLLTLAGYGRDVLAEPPAMSSALTGNQTAALDRITADSLRGHLSFLASDLLEGRDTPSRGLDLA